MTNLEYLQYLAETDPEKLADWFAEKHVDTWKLRKQNDGLRRLAAETEDENIRLRKTIAGLL